MRFANHFAAKATEKGAKARYKHIAKNTLLLAGAAARRLQVTAENAADSYARSLKKAIEDMPVPKPVKEAAKEQPAKKQPAHKKPAKAKKA